ncbi:MAG: response regulator [Desulfobacterales bacterium]|nr:response regulator [Desulfobacterales bacterium]
MKMPRVDGIDLLKGVKETAPGTAVILLTAFASGETALAAMREGAYDYVEKNFNVDDLLAIVRDALEKRERTGRRSTSRHGKGTTPGISGPWWAAARRCRRSTP